MLAKRLRPPRSSQSGSCAVWQPRHLAIGPRKAVTMAVNPILRSVCTAFGNDEALENGSLNSSVAIKAAAIVDKNGSDPRTGSFASGKISPSEHGPRNST
jgi:hypothetical protein